MCCGYRTDTAQALRFLRTNAFASARPGISRIAIVVTDGNSIDVAATRMQADLTRRAAINIMVVAVGDWLDINEMRGIVSYPSARNTLRVANYDSFGSVVFTLRDSICGSESNTLYYPHTHSLTHTLSLQTFVSS